MPKLIEYRQLARILSLYLVVQLIGLFLAFYLISPAEVVAVSGGAPGAGGSAAPGQLIFLLLYIVIAAAVMFFLFKVRRGPWLFIIIEAVVVFSATFYLLLIILSSLFPASPGYALLVSFAGAAALIVAKNKWPRLRNFTAMVASIGVGLVMGIYFAFLGFLAAFVFMAAIAIYDYIAVFITKHMVTLGTEAVNRNLAFMVGAYDVEVAPKGYLKGKETVKMSKLFAGTQNQEIKGLIKSGNVAVPAFSALGAGDLGLPLMLSVTAYITQLSYFFSLLMVACSSMGLVFTMYISKRYHMALPAIPPLFAFASISVGLFALLNKGNGEVFVLLTAMSVLVLVLLVLTVIRQGKKAQLRIEPKAQ